MRRRLVPAAVLLASLAILVIVVCVVFRSRPRPAPGVTLVNFRSLAAGMSRGRAEELLGPGREDPADDPDEGTVARYRGPVCTVVLVYRGGTLTSGHAQHPGGSVEELRARPSLLDPLGWWAPEPTLRPVPTTIPPP
jgi:hypothetical protein